MNEKIENHPLHVLHVRGYLSDDRERSRRMHSEGMAFGHLWGQVFKPPLALSLQVAPDVKLWEDGTLCEQEVKLRKVMTYLKERDVYDTLVNAVIYRRVNPRTLPKLRVALGRLIQYRLTQEVIKEVT